MAAPRRVDSAMWSRLFARSEGSGRPLQTRIRQMIVSAIAEGWLPPGCPVPSGRELAEHLGVARNTVVLVYQQLVEEGFLHARERSGYFVSGGQPRVTAGPASIVPVPEAGAPDWQARLVLRPSRQRNIVKPPDWQRYPYPFLYGQFDPSLFPINEWRECTRAALGVLEVRGWAPDLIDGDDPELVEQIRTRLLPRRGVWAAAEEIMITLGAQQALFVVAELLLRPGVVVGIEDPGYPDARNLFALKQAQLRALPVDAQGVVPGEGMAGCALVHLTPSHHCPTGGILPLARRHAILSLAARHDFIVVEDDYESDPGFAVEAPPALKSFDLAGRVLHVGSLSKTLAPGLRLGFVVGPPELIREARALRRLMHRHPPANNQRAAALFLALGHHEALLRRRATALAERAAALREALARHLPSFKASFGAGGSSFWLEGPEGFDAGRLASVAPAAGILIEPGDVFFMGDDPPRHCFRLGFSAIPAERIAPGIEALGALAREAG